LKTAFKYSLKFVFVIFQILHGLTFSKLLCPTLGGGGVLSDDARLMSDVWRGLVCQSRTSGLSRQQRGLGRLKLAQI